MGYNEELRLNFITRLNNLGFNSYLLFLGNDNNLQLIYFGDQHTLDILGKLNGTNKSSNCP